jgi:hypothetical protein
MEGTMNHRTLKAIIWVLVLLLVGFVGRRQASATNCTSSITAPCVIASSGSFTLNSNLSVSGSTNQGSICNPNGNLGTGICLNSNVNNVTINLNGHTITASGSGAYDAICGQSNSGVTIKNGIVDGKGIGFTYGVSATGDNARIEGLSVHSNSGSLNYQGMYLGNAAVAAGNVVTGSSNAGIVCGTDCVISHNVSNNNGSIGISTSSGGLVEENTVMGNSTGLSLGSGTAATAYGENVLVNTPTNVSGGQSIGKNVCSGTVC